MMEIREKLGLKGSGPMKRKTSLQDTDHKPRIEISKLNILANVDLDVTNFENLVIEDNLYGNGMLIGKEIDDQIKHVEGEDDRVKKQLAKTRQTFAKFVKERETNSQHASPLGLLESNQHMSIFSQNKKTNKRNGGLPALPKDPS